MSGLWIPSYQELKNHPKTQRVSEILDVKIVQVIGHLHLLWWWALSYAQDGDLTDFSNKEIARAAGWEGDPDVFVNSLVDCKIGKKHGFLEKGESLILHDWNVYTGKLQERREADRDRKRKERQAKKAQCPQDIRRTFAGHPQDVTRTSAPTRHNIIQQDITKQDTRESKNITPVFDEPKQASIVENYVENSPDIHKAAAEFLSHCRAESERREKAEQQGKEKKTPVSKDWQNDANFVQFMAAYPRPCEPQRAYRNWRKEVEKLRASPEELIQAAEHYAELCRKKGTLEEFTTKAANFLGRDRIWQEYKGGIPSYQRQEQSRSYEEIKRDYDRKFGDTITVDTTATESRNGGKMQENG